MKTVEYAQIEKARRKATQGMVRVGPSKSQLTMYEDDRRFEAAKMYLPIVFRTAVAGYRQYTFRGDQAQVDSYIQAVIGALTQ